MEENKFEKQVREKMDELKIHPSDSVWSKIEVRIEKKKRQKREFFFFFLLGALLMGGYLLWNTNNVSVGEHNRSEKNNEKKINAGKNADDISLQQNKTSPVTKNLIPGLTHQTPTSIETVAKKRNTESSSSEPYRHLTNKREQKIKSGKESAVAFSTPQSVPVHLHDNTDSHAEIMIKPGTAPKKEKINNEIKGAVSNETDSAAYDKISNDSLSKPSYSQNEKEKTKVKDTGTIKAASPATVKHSKKNKWKPGLLFSGGISDVSTSLLNDDKSLFSSYPNVSVSGPGVALARPSPTKAGFAFMIGIFGERNILPRVKIGVGINYKSFKTTNQVGTRNDTTGFYDYQLLNRVNTTNVYDTYSNHYNFIELPVTFKVQIGKGKKMPVIYQAGFTISELISSNALQFNQSQGYYYNDNSIFNKTQTGFNTALLITLFSKQKMPLLLGPYFHYSTSVLAREGLYNKEHFTYTGIRTEIMFGK